jgi:hypothetical protein
LQQQRRTGRQHQRSRIVASDTIFRQQTGRQLEHELSKTFGKLEEVTLVGRDSGAAARNQGGGVGALARGATAIEMQHDDQLVARRAGNSRRRAPDPHGGRLHVGDPDQTNLTVTDRAAKARPIRRVALQRHKGLRNDVRPIGKALGGRKAVGRSHHDDRRPLHAACPCRSRRHGRVVHAPASAPLQP